MDQQRDLLERIGAIGAGTAFLTLSSYLWSTGGYLNTGYTILEWFFLIMGAVLLIRGLVLEPVLINRVFEGKLGLCAGVAVSILAVYATLQGWSGAYALASLSLFLLSALIIANSITKNALLDKMGAALTTSRAGLAAAIFVFACFSYYNGASIYAVSFFIGVEILAVADMRMKKVPTYLYAAIFFACLTLLTIVIMQVFPAFNTDELVIESYAAHMFLQGVNPYIPAATQGAFYYYHFPLAFVTPLTTGGYVTGLSYPSLSFLLYVPAMLFNFEPRWMLVGATAAAFLILCYQYRKVKELALIAALIVAIDIEVIYYPAGSVTDILWVVFLALSFLMRGHTKISGVLYGLSLASKQLPLIVLPFYLYMMYKEKGKTGAFYFAGSAAAAFFVVNAPFIAMGPGLWLSGLLSPETSPLLGVGQGIGMISFVGYFSLPSVYFLAMEAFAVILLFLFYVKEFNRYKYSFLAFPLIIFFFNYRFLLSYAIYWPFLALLALPEIAQTPKITVPKINWRSTEALALALFIIVPSGAALYLHTNSQIQINGISQPGNPVGVPGYITSMYVNVSSNPPINFRIFTAGQITTVNGLLWQAVSVTYGNGWALYYIEPMTPQSALQQGLAFKIEAYYGQQQGFYSSNGLVVNTTYGDTG